MSRRKKDRTIFRVMVLPLLSILALELFVLLGSLRLGGVITKLNQNAQDMLSQQVENRGNYLFNDMIGNWSNLSMLSEYINEQIQEKINHGKLELADFNDNNEKCVELLAELRPDLIEVMYNKQVSGIFLILNTRSIDEGNIPETLPGIYLRDLDPTSTPSQRNEDILTERAPVEVVRSGRIATDTSWQPAFSQTDSVEQPFFYKPFQAAYSDGKRLNTKDYGYWTTETYCLSGDNRRAISYSIPLILADGTVYGVLGIELLEDYIQSLLPCSELMERERGSYLLAVSQEGDNKLIPVLLSSELITNKALEELQFILDEQNPKEAADSSGKYYGAVKPLGLYSNNAPFDSDKWYLVGISTKDNLFAFARQMQQILLISFVITIVIGLIGILLVSYRLSQPIQFLSKEVEKAKKSNMLPILPETGIREIDRFSDAIIRLGREVVDSSTRFLRIMDMASVDLGGYEIKDGSDSVFVTENYFPLLGVENVDIHNLTAEEFKQKHQQILNRLDRTISEDGSVAYQVPLGQGRIRYLRFENVKEGERYVGLVEDVTTSTLERIRVERERDCDGLTKLYARRGFRKAADELFLRPDKMKTAALLMIDLDNLKTTNDKFGHKFGDIYIQTAAQCFMENTPDNAICARISGDEFLILFYGFESQDEIRESLHALYEAIHKVEFVLPNGNNMGLSASGGVAWYPADSKDLSELMKYSDFAMYQVKRSKKGALKEFDAAAYQVQMEQNQSRLEFNQLLESGQIEYYFQPIFDSRTGEVFAYEALMRAEFPTLQSPETVLRIAKEEGRMHDIEYITLFRSCECYSKLLERGAVSDKALLFINSIANECMTEQEVQTYRERFANLQSRIVIEITESEHLDMDLVERKRQVEGFSKMFALDDYGSGYNSELNLLELKPQFIKVDITIVRDISHDVNKQQIVSNMVQYAHSRNMQVIVEGLETAEELQTVLDLEVDLLQGFFLASPGAVPPSIRGEAYQLIQEHGGIVEV